MSAYYNEIDEYCVQWLRNLIAAGHIAAGDVDNRPIQEVTPDDLKGYAQAHFFAGLGGWSCALRLARWSDDRPVWTGSCPCQPFSAAGRHGGADDERHLWPAFQRLISQCNPATVFGEQVASTDGRTWLTAVRLDLEALGFAVGAADLCAAGIGAPHIRQRLYWVADSNKQRRHGEQVPIRGSGSRQDDAETVRGGGSGRLADAAGTGRRGRESSPGGGCAEPRGPGAACGVDNAEQQGLEGHTRHGDDGDRPGRDGAGTTRPVAPAGGAGPWFDARPVPCRDGVARLAPPIESGLYPLDDGTAFSVVRDGSGKSRGQAPWRVGMLKAAGNAIVPPLAAEFIGAYMDCCPSWAKGEGE